jgi:hypothetical protein
MSYPGFGRGQPQYSPLDNNAGTPYYASPATYSQPFPPYDPSHGDLGSPGIEMHGTVRPSVQHRQSAQSQYSNTGVPGPPPLPNNATRPPSMHYDSGKPMYSSPGTRPPMPQRESVQSQFSDTSYRPTPPHRESGQSMYSNASTLFPSPSNSMSSFPKPSNHSPLCRYRFTTLPPRPFE